MKQKDFNKIFVESITDKKKLSAELLSQIKDGPKLSAVNAVEVYREDYEARLTEALRNTYRAIHFIIGDEDFNRLSRAYIDQYASTSSDLDDYGHDFSVFTQKHELSHDYIFLFELAHFEWSFREIFHLEQNAGLEAHHLLELLQQDNELVQLTNSARLLHCQFQIMKLYALKEENQNEPFEFQEPESILIYKNDSRVKTKTLTKNQAELLSLFLSPISIPDCFQRAPKTISPEEIQELFQILGAERLLIKATNEH